jgi:hypothetical protein
MRDSPYKITPKFRKIYAKFREISPNFVFTLVATLNDFSIIFFYLFGSRIWVCQQRL